MTTKAPITADKAKLSNLILDPVNVRKTDRGGKPNFAASIHKRGVIQPLTVRRDVKSSLLLVTDGGERLDGLLFLKKNGSTAAGVLVTDDYEVPVTISDRSDADARATSLALNLIRSNMHPVDEFEALAQMVKDGATLEEIAAENARPVEEIRAALGLASIAPEIREAWRKGQIGGEAAQAYAQTQDLEHQVRIFKKLKGRAGEEWQITQEIAGDDRHHLGAMLKFVGQAAYEKAGHHLNPSLFADDDRHGPKVDNIPALRAMAAKKIEVECERLKTEGWGWAIDKAEKPKDLYAWRRIPANSPKAKKAMAGCTVGIDYNGKLEIERGYVKPGVSVKIEKTAAEKAAARKAGPAKPATISAALAGRMSEALTKASAAVIAECDPDTVLRVALAGLICSSTFSSSPVCLENKGMGARDEDDADEYIFGAELARLAKMGRPALLTLFAKTVAASIDLRVMSPERVLLSEYGEVDGIGDGAPALTHFVPQKLLQAALLVEFDPVDYFTNAPGAMTLQALADMGVEPLKNAKKAAHAAAAADHAKKAGWLPPQLRTAGYAGPKAKASPKKAKASSKKKRQ